MIADFNVCFSDIDSRGFLLIRSFLDQEELEFLRRDYEAAALEENSNYSLRRLSAAALQRVDQKCRAVIAQTRKFSEVRVDLLNDGVYFATFSEKPTLVRLRPGPQAFPWHQDHENYWLWRDTKDYLNFYIPVVKPDPEKSNLTVAPFDRFRQRAPEVHQRLLRRGATRVLKSGRHWIVKDDDQGGKVGRLDFDLAEIEETPHLKPGDLLLMRGDVIHRTQDSSTRRIAASIRYVNGRTLLDRSTMAKGGLVKAVMMSNARYLYEPAFRCFESAGSETLPAVQLDRYLKRHRESSSGQPSSPGRVSFMLRLAREKCRGLCSPAADPRHKPASDT